MVIFAKKTVIGWEEWLGLPELGLPAIKAKVDTGAQTSSLHAMNIKVVLRNGIRFVKFRINPIHKNKKFVVHCSAPLIDRRYVVDSGGHREKRYVIETEMILGRKHHRIELTLTNRKTMAFRMLLGRQAMEVAKLVVDPVESCRMGKLKLEQVREIYTKKLEQEQIVYEEQHPPHEDSNTGLQS